MEVVCVHHEVIVTVCVYMCVQLSHDLGKDEETLKWSEQALGLQFENGSPGQCMVRAIFFCLFGSRLAS